MKRGIKMIDEIEVKENRRRDRKREAFEYKMESDVDGTSYLFAMLLLDEAVKDVKGFLQDDLDERFKRAKYTIMDYANKMKMVAPFHDDESLRDVFDAAMELDKMDWDWGFDKEFEAGLVARMPKALMDLYKGRIGAETKTVLVAEAENFYPYLNELIEDNEGVEFVLTTQSDVNRRALLAALGQLDLDNVQIIAADVYEKGFTKDKADLIFTLPLGHGTSASIAAVNNLLCNLNDRAKLLVTVPGRVIGLSGVDFRDFRRKISKEYKLNEMAELPAGLFDYTALKTCLLDIERTEPKEYDDVSVRRYVFTTADGEAPEEGFRSRRLGRGGRHIEQDPEIEVKEKVSIKAKDLWNDEKEWNIPAMLAANSDEYTAFYGSSVPKTRLDEVASVMRGRALYEYERVKEGNVGVLSISNLTGDEISFKNLDRIQTDESDWLDLYRLKEGDLLLPARGTAPKTAIFHEKAVGCPCVASVNLIVIRPRGPELNSLYLKIFLDSALGKMLLRGVQQGDRLINLSHNDLKGLEIPLPSREEQDEKAQKYEKEYEIYRETVDNAVERWNRAKEDLQKF